MKNIAILFTLFSFCINAQTAFQNNGNIKIHDEGSVGFHIDLINNGIFNANLGFTGFYSDNSFLTVSGNNIAKFYNVDVDVFESLDLYTTMKVSNTLTFTNGKVITPRLDPNISLYFDNHQAYFEETDTEHVNGYASYSGSDEFIFPIGHSSEELRPVIIPSSSSNSFYKAAYFFENPNTPSTLSTFNTETSENSITAISDKEFWDIDGSEETEVTLTWNHNSDITGLVSTLEDLVVVGWHKQEAIWKNLGNTDISGDISSGMIRSISFIPSEYAIVTFGSNNTVNSSDNFYVTPNGDGVNDTLEFANIENYTNNHLYIFNRWGAKLYEAYDYNNSWSGISEHTMTIDKDKKLPTGTYFYVFKGTLDGKESERVGWIYIQR